MKSIENELKEIKKKLASLANSNRPSKYLIRNLIQDIENVIEDISPERSYNSETLTKRESEVATYMVKGFTNREIASALRISNKTVEFHLKAIYQKTDCSNRAESVAFIVENRILKNT